MLSIICFFAFHVTFVILSGGIVSRLIYSLTVSNGFFNFLKNYALSYQITHSQIHSMETFIPEVNDKLETLLALALQDKIDVGISTDYRYSNSIILRIRVPAWFSQNQRTLHFYMNMGLIDEEKYALTPMVFILAQKVYDKKIYERKQTELLEKKQKI